MISQEISEAMEKAVFLHVFQIDDKTKKSVR